MPRAARLPLLAILFAVIAAVELRLTWSTLVFVAHPERVHFRLPISDRLVKGGEAFGGMRPGDRVLAIDGVAVATRWQTHQQVIRRPVGAPVRVTVERGGQRMDVDAPTRAWPMGVPERASTFLQNVVTAWFCLALGFLVALRRPAQSIGGDSYDYIVTGGGQRLLVTVADVAGKGVPAALLMSNLQAALRGLTLSGREESLAETLARLNELVFDSTPANRFITLFALAYDANTRSVRYSSAGHNPAVLLRAGAGAAEWIRTKGVALGLRRQGSFAESGLALASGDTLVLYTDGVTEAMNAAGEEFGEDRLAQAIVRGSALPAPALRDELVAAVDAFAGGAPQHDDITLVVSRVV